MPSASKAGIVETGEDNFLKKNDISPLRSEVLLHITRGGQLAQR